MLLDDPALLQGKKSLRTARCLWKEAGLLSDPLAGPVSQPAGKTCVTDRTRAATETTSNTGSMDRPQHRGAPRSSPDLFHYLKILFFICKALEDNFLKIPVRMHIHGGKNITEVILTWCCTAGFVGQSKGLGSHSSTRKKRDAKLGEKNTVRGRWGLRLHVTCGLDPWQGQDGGSYLPLARQGS